MHVLVYVLHYIIARFLYDDLVAYGVSPLTAFLLAGALLFVLARRRKRRRARRR